MRPSLPLFAALLIPIQAQADQAAAEQAPSIDPVPALQRQIDEGKLTLPTGRGHEFLKSVLAIFDLDPASQVLVFSKTSQQNDYISPSTPRAIFFDRDTYVGWVSGGFAEIMTYDPHFGGVFYTLRPEHEPGRRQVFRSEASCLQCHESSRTSNVPGPFVRSVYPDYTGRPILSQGSFNTDHTSPIEQRWGGWYVTGQHGNSVHMGNTIASYDRASDHMEFDPSPQQNISSLDDFFDTSLHLRPDSDVVALMVLEHQVGMHNILTEAAMTTRRALQMQARVRELTGDPEPDDETPLEGTALRVVESQAQRVLRYLLFCDEQPLDGGIQGGEDFQRMFRAATPATADGLSLADFQLHQRLFKNRCSYMIYSTAFKYLPAELKSLIFKRLDLILAGADPSEDFVHLAPSECERIRAILRETLPEDTSAWPTPST
jgi:hypothetical protein